MIIIYIFIVKYVAVKNLLPARIRHLVCRKTPRDSPIKEDNSTGIVITILRNIIPEFALGGQSG